MKAYKQVHPKQNEGSLHQPEARQNFKKKKKKKKAEGNRIEVLITNYELFNSDLFLDVSGIQQANIPRQLDQQPDPGSTTVSIN